MCSAPTLMRSKGSETGLMLLFTVPLAGLSPLKDVFFDQFFELLDDN
jgi:hypothetical protein